MKPFCINENCSNFLPEDKRGYYKKKETAEEPAAEEKTEKPAKAEKKTAAKKTTKKTTAKKTTKKKETE